MRGTGDKMNSHAFLCICLNVINLSSVRELLDDKTRMMTYNKKDEREKLVKITLLISTYNWIDALKRVLDGVLEQTILPDEIIIADDGSRLDTKEYIDKVRKHFPMPFIHVWHEDNGFRRSVILNKAIAKATGDYIIQIDGDVVPERHFIQDHCAVMKKGYFVCGSRVMLQQDGSIRTSHCINLLRSKLLRNLIASVVPVFSERHVRGCNLAFWRDNFIAVNGYNEDIIGWGHEDREMVYRLLNSGVMEHRLKFGGIIKHIYHGATSLGNKSHNYSIQCDTIAHHSIWCENGISKYL
jgi:glycosyltransferase involved in cell wall biosynthesis